MPYAQAMDASAEVMAQVSAPRPVSAPPAPPPFNPGISTQQVNVRVDFALAPK